MQKYDTFLNILEEIKNRENWEKYKNDDMFGDEIFLYERADEIASEVNKKYGTNIVFRGGYDCWFEITFSIKDKSLEEVIKEDVKVQIDRFCENINKVKDKVRDDFYFGLVLLSEEVAAQVKEFEEKSKYKTD